MDILDNPSANTIRIKLPQGWLVISSRYDAGVHQIVINDPDHLWKLGD